MYEAMKRFFACFLFTIMVFTSGAQSIHSKLAKAYAVFASDPQLKNAMASLYVVDAATGQPVFDKNAQIGLAPASTQKIITAATAYELLGKDFRYQTKFGYYEYMNDHQSNNGIYIRGSGDPTLGSWRWPNTTESSVMNRLLSALREKNILNVTSFILDNNNWEAETIPGGWVWDDIGNYYGAGAGIINWRENQYDLVLRSGEEKGAEVKVVKTVPYLYNYEIRSMATAAAKGTGDNAYIYFPVGSSHAVVRGTIPAGEKSFTISGAMPSGSRQFVETISDSLIKNGIQNKNRGAADLNTQFSKQVEIKYFHTETSPPLDSISYWFLRRSINLYGEALVKTMAAQDSKTASTENGADLVRDFWSKKNMGISKTELNLHDGSGLSPLNRTTTHAQVAILQYAAKQPWFNSYYHGFPEFNNMKMKSGTISGVKGFCGYHTSASGKEYIFSFLVNNYNGSSSSLVKKMYLVLDQLK